MKMYNYTCKFLMAAFLQGALFSNSLLADGPKPANPQATSEADTDKTLILPDLSKWKMRHGPHNTESKGKLAKSSENQPDFSNNAVIPPRRVIAHAQGKILVKMRTLEATPANTSGTLSAKRSMVVRDPTAEIQAILGKSSVKKAQKLVKAIPAPSSMSAARSASVEAMETQNPTTTRAAIAQKASKQGLDRWMVVDLTGKIDPDEALRLLQASDRIEAAEPDYMFHLAGTTEDQQETSPTQKSASREALIKVANIPNETSDPKINDQWHLVTSRAKDAWQHLKKLGLEPGGNPNVIVAVIDSGVDYTHPDLIANMWVNPLENKNGADTDKNGYVDDIHGVNTTNTSGDPIDNHGHGTHVAGIIAAQANNGQGGAGVAYNVKIMAIKAAQYSGTLTSSSIAAGIYYAVENGADVINMSFGGYGKSQLVEDALAVAVGQAVLVAAAGNDGKGNELQNDQNYGVMYPAAYNWVLGVMAQNQTPSPEGDHLCSFSNWDDTAGNSVEYELMAPGASILSILPGGKYSAWSGTSTATPVVSGAAALLRTRWPNRNLHTSRYLMGQLASNGRVLRGRSAPANPTIVKNYQSLDVLAALTNAPKPKLGYTGHWIFDTTNINSKNDDDGIIDAGETVDIAVVIRNQWGSASNVSVKLEAWAEGASAPDPYVTINAGTINYGAIGPFSEKDNGFIRDSNGAIIGVLQPFRITLSPGTPNDHVIPFRLTITARNGSDATDSTVYSNTARFTSIAQNGRQLPSLITEDTVLDKDTFWIIDRPVLVPEGVTLTITEGTTVQFWSSDPKKIYTSNQMPFLQVEGTLRVEGTEKNPVHLLVSELHTSRPVSIRPGITIDPYTSIQYAIVDNPYIGLQWSDAPNNTTWSINHVSHCIFRQKSQDGSIDGTYDSRVLADHVTHSRFIRLGHWFNGFLGGTTHTSLFDHVQFSGNRIVENATHNVFLKKNLDHTRLSKAYGWGAKVSRGESLVNEQTSFRDSMTAFAMNSISGYVNSHQWLIDFVDSSGGVWKITNQTEAALFKEFNNDLSTTYGWHLLCMELKELPDKSKAWMWDDGTPVDHFAWAPGYPVAGDSYAIIKSDGWYSTSGTGGYERIFLLPGVQTREQIVKSLDDHFASDRFSLRHGTFHSNAILNAWNDPNPEHWMQFSSESFGSNDEVFFLISHNYWGTTSRTLINSAITDYHDNFNNPEIVYEPILEAPPQSSYPFVVNVRLDAGGISGIKTVGTEEVLFTVTFNRDMSSAVHPQVSFGPAAPWTDYVVRPVNGGWINPRTWTGTATITHMIRDGRQCIRVAGAVAADDAWLVTGDDSERFQFTVQTTNLESTNLIAKSGPGYVDLSWTYEGFDLLAGYNVYRSTAQNGQYMRVNTTLIPHGRRKFRDTSAKEGITYFYYFSPMLTTFTELAASYKVTGTPLDGTPPVINHIPITEAKPGTQLSVVAVVTDNVSVTKVQLFTRKSGTSRYEQRPMIPGRDNRYSAVLRSNEVRGSGIEYYIKASDGVNVARSARARHPHEIRIGDSETLRSDAKLSGLTLSSGRLSPNFRSGTRSYTAEVGNSIRTIRVTPTAANRSARIKVNGEKLSSGTTSSRIPLTAGTNKITIVVTAEDGKTDKIYTIHVSRTTSTNVSLSELTLSSGNLSPGFHSGIRSYTVEVGNATHYIQITPTAAQSSAKIKVNGTTIASGTKCPPVALAVGANTITINVTNRAGTAKSTYTVVVARAVSSANRLSRLAINNVTLTPSFKPSKTNYSATVPQSLKKVSFKPVAKSKAAKITINGKFARSNKFSLPYPLKSGKNVFKISVNAQDGRSMIYRIIITRE